MQINKSHIIKKASEYFNQRNDVLFAYLFGSYAGNRATSRSDIDIAVYLVNESCDSTKKMDLIHSLSMVLNEDALDLVILNQAPVTLAINVLKKHIMIIDKNPLIRHQFESLIMRKYFDFSIIEKQILERRFITWILHESEAFIGKASEGEVVVVYFEPSVTPHMKVSGSPFGWNFMIKNDYHPHNPLDLLDYICYFNLKP